MPHPLRRSSSSVSRRTALGGVGTAALALSVGPLHRVAAQDATPMDMTAHPIVGAWRVIPAPPGPPLVLILYHADGTLLFSTPSGSPAPPDASHAVTYETPAYGVWESTGERSVALSATLIDTDEAGTFLGTLNFHGTVQIDETGDAYTYTGVVEPVDPGGSVVATFPVTTSATRIRVDHARAAAAPPMAGTPAP
jgi:hypothetical protein